MATTTVTKTIEYDAAGRPVREVTVTETVGPYATGGIVHMRSEHGPEVKIPVSSPVFSEASARAVLDALLRLKRERGGDLGLS